MPIIVRYHVPEDKDDEKHPNVFLLKTNGRPVRLSDLFEAFPLPGQYHFRAKKAYRGTHIWLDVVGAHSEVPLFEGDLILKVTRISFESASKPSKQPENSTHTVQNNHNHQRVPSSQSVSSVAATQGTVSPRSNTPSPVPPMQKVNDDDIFGTLEAAPPVPQNRPVVSHPTSDLPHDDLFA
eukprot:TRINITY_DN778460_c0_g1_i1.p1 TRINITY_DN778460_c0_g1~~TRINITY_DN778460_c0_g1_i1.p1  ORF type:complete len:181 (+),score=38.73 TRINITY_DN778460_c0_g1_i1:74-616(+)